MIFQQYSILGRIKVLLLHSKMMSMKKIALAIVVVTLLGCSRVPISGRRQMNLVSEQELITMSDQQYRQFLSEAQVAEGTQQSEMVKRVGNKIAAAVEEYMRSHGQAKRIEGFKWEFNLVNDPTVNAWCMPGGKICFYTGILPLTQDENGLAVVMGHEVAHAIARHGNERMSKGLMTQMGGVALSVALSNKAPQTQQLFNQAYGVGTGLSGLAFSRKNELESDQLGLVFMQLAGYDAHKAPDFWKRMAATGEQPPEFLSTHPSDERRVQEIQSFLASSKFKKHTKK